MFWFCVSQSDDRKSYFHFWLRPGLIIAAHLFILLINFIHFLVINCPFLLYYFIIYLPIYFSSFWFLACIFFKRKSNWCYRGQLENRMVRLAIILELSYQFNRNVYSVNRNLKRL